MSNPNVNIATTTDIHGFFTSIFPGPVLFMRDPVNGADNGYAVGQVWINQTAGANVIWMLSSYVAGGSVWSQVFP